MRLTPGSFFGTPDRASAAGAFTFAARRGDVPPAAVPRHTHDEAHYVLVVSGGYVTEARGGGACGPATLIFNPAATTHRDRFSPAGGRFFSISLSPPLAAALDAARPVPIVLRDHRCTDIARRIYAEYMAQDPASPMILEGLGLELVGYTLRQRIAGSRGVPPWLRRVKDRAAEEFDQALTIETLARDAGVHSSHLVRAFRQHFGVTPGEFIRARRIERACELLAGPSPLAHIAMGVGFADQTQLTRAFTRAVGMPPGAYRRLIASRGRYARRSPLRAP